MPKVTGLTPNEVQKLNNALEALMHKGMDAVEPRLADNKLERVAFKGLQMAVKFAGHLSPEKKLGDLVLASNKLLPKLAQHFNVASIAGYLPPALKTDEAIDLADRAGATALAGLLREAKAAAPAPVVPVAPVPAPAVVAQPAPAVAAEAPAAPAAAPVASPAPVVPAANLKIAETPKIPEGPKLPRVSASKK